jgi:hypothetical protein
MSDLREDELVRRDTPIEPRPAVHGLRSSAYHVLEQLSGFFDMSDDLQTGFEAWQGLREFQRTTAEQVASERDRIVLEESLFAGALRRLGEVPLDSGTAAGLASESAEVNAGITALSQRIQRTLIERTQSYGRVKTVKIKLFVRGISSSVRMLHVERLSEEDGLLLMFVLTGKIPSRYGAHLDDSVSEVSEPPALFFEEEGVSLRDGDRVNSQRCLELLNGQTAVLPVRGFIPMPIGQRWLRWVARGPLMEAEFIEPSGFRNALSCAEAEEILAELLRYQRLGRIGLELGR